MFSEFNIITGYTMKVQAYITICILKVQTFLDSCRFKSTALKY